MFRIILGVVLLTIGCLTLINSSDFGFIYTGGIIGGILLIVSGINEESRKAQSKSDLASISSNWDDIVSRLQNDQSIDDIAKHYYDTLRVPPTRTILVTSYIIHKIAESGAEDALGVAHYVVSKQAVDSTISPEQTIDKFNFVDQVYFVDDKVVSNTIILQDEQEETKSATGTLILSKGYLFFFARKFEIEDAAELVGSARDLIPIVGILSDGFSLVGGLSKELEDYFNSEKISKLKRRFANENSFAIPLVKINRLDIVKNDDKNFSPTWLRIVVENETAEEKIHLLNTISGGKDWFTNWVERLTLACIGEGRLMVRPSKAPN